jgi:predicted O-linked N-acetylglucosamine transferase (SPINDLY family)
VGASILHATGAGARSLGELAAPDDDAFVRIAAGLARDRSRLAGWRDAEGLRAVMERSAVCDARGLAERFTAALESLVAERASHA